MFDLPRIALSVRQPWAWAIVQAGKPVENRTWRAPNPGLKFRGPFAVHASRGLTQAEYDDAAAFMAAIGVTGPPAADLERGGIIGVATVVDVVKAHDSQWFFGPRALVLADPRPVAFLPAPGALGFFQWKHDPDLAPPAPARWMKPRPAPAPRELPIEPDQARLL
jgi:hypothetical protein